MRTVFEKYNNVKPLSEFDWSVYADGWNGKSLMKNPKIETDEDLKKSKVKVYCHESYANSDCELYFHGVRSGEDVSKDLREGGVIHIQNIKLIGKDDALMTTAAGGSAVIKLAKESKFFEMLGMSKEQFKTDVLSNADMKQKFLDSGYLAKVGRNGVASLYEGVLVRTENEFHTQIALGKNATKAYVGKIIGSNKGGYIMDIQGIKCFLPGSQAMSNKIVDYESLVGTEMEVMIMKYIEGSGFLVSRKKYLDTVRPAAVAQLREEWKKNPERVFTGTVTGATHFGIFIELNDYYTGLLHRTYATEETLAKIASNPELTDEDVNAKKNYPPGTEIEVKIYDITDDNRLVFTNIMDVEERTKIVEERNRILAEAEAKAKAEAEEAKKLEEERRLKKMMNQQTNNFKNNTVSLEDLKK